MQGKPQGCLAAAIWTVLALGSVLWAAEPNQTVITVEKMHCGSCAKKIAARLQEVPGVAAVQTSRKAKTATVTPKAGVVLSPRALWEAVEKANEQPVKLEGPSGTFTSKPQS